MSQTDLYRSIQTKSEGFYKEKGSKFLAFAFPCTNQKDAKVHLERLKKEHPNACHVCFAWRFGTIASKYVERFSDDGEPSNSAGKPIFGQIQAFDLTQILIAVVRYYGGTNLGVGGLINAYKTASKEALEHSTIIESYVSDYYLLKFNYDLTGEAMNLLNKSNAIITEQGYEGSQATINFKIRTSESQKLKEEFEQFFGFKLNYLKTE
jgi:uncharacterized YigZ family protein